MLAVGHEMFELWHRFKKQEVRRSDLRAGVEPLRQRLHTALMEGASCGQKKTTGLCRALLKREPALWRFARTPGLEPTNNLAERMLRPAVIWRKKSFGSSSLAGCRYVERMLSVVQTLRLQNRKVIGFLSQTLTAHRADLPLPALVRA